ncbi:MAG: 50S ribosomal protein L3 N(5)-glutamine methyltransferase [Saccharospirillaceae bacterium]|nr:50S ribosomal protein L3 N(5)-glutamine methyltransferase [Pseudomonadales bacterium]NRB80228.1 50S ribosomal protein L3 N(5)-glutamine methyltransferase [Saccharospirillaceae bacterium]
MSKLSVSLDQSIISFATIQDWLRFSCSQMGESNVFFGHGTDNVYAEGAYLISSILHLPLDGDLSIFASTQLSVDEKIKLYAAIKSRCVERLPIPYISGKCLYAGVEFNVNTFTLIPRSPIFELIEQQFQPWLTQYPGKILDLCCGSGCLGILAAMHFEQSSVDLADLSKEALLVAKENIIKHDLNHRVQVKQGDLFGAVKQKQYDLIISNPPYVDEQDLSDMPLEFLAEPKMALGSGEDGLTHVKQILAQAQNHLNDDGYLVCEVGNTAAAVDEFYAPFAFTWLEFEQGGMGIFIINKQELINLNKGE